ncbi:MAG: hypothetical protein ACR2HF_10030 [Methylococcaceae bacterium]
MNIMDFASTDKYKINKFLEVICARNILSTNTQEKDAGTPDELMDIVVEELNIKIRFVSKWNPPHKFYDELEERGISITGYFYDRQGERIGLCTEEHFLEAECKNDPDWIKENMSEEDIQQFNMLGG